MVPCLPRCQTMQLAAGGLPVVGHDREVAGLGAIPEEGALGRPQTDRQVAVGRRVALLVAASGHEGGLGPLAHEAVGLDGQLPPGPLRQRGHAAAQLAAHVGRDGEAPAAPRPVVEQVTLVGGRVGAHLTRQARSAGKAA